jgi:hypothetical protein
MWFGLLHLTSADGTDPEDGDMAILSAYERDRIFTVGGPVAMVPQLLRLLHQAASETGGVEDPRCPSCGDALEVPPVGGPEWTCAST